MATTAEAFEIAVQHHRSGQLREAEAIYRQILAVDPLHAGTLHLVGLLAHQAKQHELAVQYISKAIAVLGNEPAFHSNLGEAYRALGKRAEAEQCYRRALQLNPNFPVARNNLGNLLAASGQQAEALAEYEQAIRLLPTYAEPHNNVGTIRQAQGDVAGAMASYREALRLKPDYVDAYLNMANVLKSQGNLTEAAAYYQQVVRLAPSRVDVQVGLGAILQSLRRLEEASECYRQALEVNPRFALAHNNLAAALKDLGRLDEAIASYRAALECDPNFAEAYYNLGIVLNEQGQLAEAAEAFQAALRVRPDFVDAMCNYGILLQNQGQPDEAMEWFERALGIKPDFAAIHLNRGNIFKLRKMFTEAVAEYREALRLQPLYPEAYNNLALTFNDMAQPDQAIEASRKGLEQLPTFAQFHANMAIALHAQGRGEEALATSRRAVEMEPDNAAQHGNFLYSLNFVPGQDPARVFEEHLHWAACHAEPLTAKAPPHANDRSPERRLRIGYSSAYFRQHAVNFFTEPMLVAHAHDQFEIFCYSDADVCDAATQRLQQAADAWRDVRRLTDEELARQVRNDEIDIFVDLTGHIGNNRLLAFARKPAPVQVTYIGYQNTTGMSAMDYRLTDERADPPGLTDQFYTEKLFRLPRCFFCYQPSDDAPSVMPSPALSAGFVTFGSFNNFAKVSPEVIDTWLTIMARVPRSRLLILAYSGGYLERHLHSLARERDIEPDRIELFDKRPRSDYLLLQQQADIALDPFPFNGHTTTCDSIWQGVPVVKFEGDRYASRFGSSVLANVGLENLIAHSSEEYIEIAVQLATDRDRLAQLRAELRPRMAASVLLDFKGFTRNLEQVYRQMWRAWCQT